MWFGGVSFKKFSTKNSLLQEHIYCPKKWDKSIRIYLQMGFKILVWDSISRTYVKLSYDPMKEDSIWISHTKLRLVKTLRILKFGQNWWDGYKPIFTIRVSDHWIENYKNGKLK